MVDAIPSRMPPEVVVFNDEIEAFLAPLPPIWETGVEAARLAREEGRSVFGRLETSEMASTMEIDGPGGALPLRVFEIERPAGVYLHIHGGGWVLGGAHHHDRLLEHLATEARLSVVSVDYRLAPEHPYPAAPDDCQAAASWLIEHAEARFGTNVLTIGGESAGAHLALTTMLRLRDLGARPFAAANLAYGIYDLRLTPSARAFGDRPLVLTTDTMAWFVDQYRPPDLEHPDVSPIFADLTGLPPAMFTVGDHDPLLDDTLFMAARWGAAGIQTNLDVWPGAIHAFDYFDTAYGRSARSRMHEFLATAIEHHVGVG